jgi:hypothetical protein
MKKLKGVDGKLDEAWSRLVKLRAGMSCEVCGKTTTLNSHHIYSRSNRSVRWNPDNGICLCVAHHTFGSFCAHKSPTEFTEWLYDRKGAEFMNTLKIKAHMTIKYSKFEKELLLKSLKNEIAIHD